MRTAVALAAAGLVGGGLVALAPTPASAAYTTVVADRGGRLQACRDVVGDRPVVRFRLDNRRAAATQQAAFLRDRDGRSSSFVVRAGAGAVSGVRTFRVLPGDELVGAVLRDGTGLGVDVRRRDLLPC